MNRIMKKILVLLSMCVLFCLSATLANEKTGQKTRQLVLTNKLRPTDKTFFGLLLVPYIICFFAATGVWPHYPQYMQNSVNEMGQQVFSQSDEHIQNFCRGKFLFNAQAHRPVFFKGIFFPFVPKEEWSHKTTTKLVDPTTMRPTPAETKETEGTTTTTVTTTRATTVPTTTTPATTKPTTTTPAITRPTTTTPATTTKATTTTPDVGVVTFDPNQPVTVICNCSQPKLVGIQGNASTVKIEKSINTTPSSSTTEPTQPTHIKIDVKNVISFFDLILSYLNVTRSNQ